MVRLTGRGLVTCHFSICKARAFVWCINWPGRKLRAKKPYPMVYVPEGGHPALRCQNSAKICSRIRGRPWDRCTILDIGSQFPAGPIAFLNSCIWFKSSEKPCYQAQIDQSRTVKSQTWVCTFRGNFRQFPLIFRPWNFQRNCSPWNSEHSDRHSILQMSREMKKSENFCNLTHE